MRELSGRFTEVERRVRALVEENARLRGRVAELEEGLGRAGEAAREAESLRARNAQVQDRLKRLLRMLESIGPREAGQAGAEEPAP